MYKAAELHIQFLIYKYRSTIIIFIIILTEFKVRSKKSPPPWASLFLWKGQSRGQYTECH